MKDLLPEIERHLSEGRNGEALTVLQKLKGLPSELSHVLSLTAGEMKKHKEENRRGFLTSEEVQVFGNRMRARLLRIAAAIEDPEKQVIEDLYKESPLITMLSDTEAIIGQEIQIEGNGFQTYDDQQSRVMIGKQAAFITNWSPNTISGYIPEGLRPGSYQLIVKTKDARSNAKEINVSLLTKDQQAALERKESILLLIAQVYGDNPDQLLQADLTEQLQMAIAERPVLEDRIIVAAWPEPFFGPNALMMARQAGRQCRAQLILFGRTGQEKSFYPRLAILNEEEAFRRTEERFDVLTRQMQAFSHPEHLFSEEKVKSPITLLHFITGWYRHKTGDYEAARKNFLDTLNSEALSSIDQASFRFAAGESSMRLGNDILERPYRSKEDVKKGKSLIEESFEHLRQAARLYLENDRRPEAGRTYLRLSMSLATYSKNPEGLRESIAAIHKALPLLDRQEQPIELLMAYYNLSSNLEWLSWKCTLMEREELLRKSLEAARQALQLAELHGTRADQVNCRTAGIAVVLGHLHHPDRDRNLEEAIALVEMDLPFFEQHPEHDPGRHILSLNHLGRCYLHLLSGDRMEHLRKAKEAFLNGVNRCSPDYFPEFFNMIGNNLQLTERLLEKTRKKRFLDPYSSLPEYEAEHRFDLEIARHQNAGDTDKALRTAFRRLQWATATFGTFQLETGRSFSKIGALFSRLPRLQEAGTYSYAALLVFHDCLKIGHPQFPLIDQESKKLKEIYTAAGNEVLANTLIGQSAPVAADRARALFNEALKQASNDGAKALEFLHVALSWFPLYPEALVNKASLLLQQQKAGEALENLNLALVIHPSDTIALYNRASAFYMSSKLESAVTDLRVALQLDPDNAEFLYVRASIYIDLAEEKKAKADIIQLFDLDQENPRHYILRSRFHRTFKRMEEAVADLSTLKTMTENEETRKELDRQIDALRSEGFEN